MAWPRSPRTPRADTCVLLDADGNGLGGDVVCFGSGEDGRLGTEDNRTRGDAPGTMGDALGVISLGANYDAKSISASARGSCAVVTGGFLKCAARSARPRARPCARSRAPRAASRRAARAAHRFATRRRARAGWGSGSNGRLGQGDTLSRGDRSGTMGDALPPVNLGTDYEDDYEPDTPRETDPDGPDCDAILEERARGKALGHDNNNSIGQGRRRLKFVYRDDYHPIKGSKRALASSFGRDHNCVYSASGVRCARTTRVFIARP